MRPFSYSLAEPVAVTFAGRSKRDRDELLRIFRRIAESPFLEGDWILRRSNEREIQKKRFGKWLVSFWTDAPILEVRIVDLERLS